MPDSVQITPAIPERPVARSQELFFGKVFTFVTLDDRGVSSSTPEGLGDVQVDDENDIRGKTQSSPLPVTCPESAPVLLRPVFSNYPVPNTRKLRATIHYGKLVLRFTSAPKPDGSLCMLVSQRGALPIHANILCRSQFAPRY